MFAGGHACAGFDGTFTLASTISAWGFLSGVGAGWADGWSMHKQRDQNNDRDGNAEKQKQK
jgi:hypothetical protein